jgi:hypothetical protein
MLVSGPSKGVSYLDTGTLQDKGLLLGGGLSYIHPGGTALFCTVAGIGQGKRSTGHFDL